MLLFGIILQYLLTSGRGTWDFGTWDFGYLFDSQSRSLAVPQSRSLKVHYVN